MVVTVQWDRDRDRDRPLQNVVSNGVWFDWGQQLFVICC